MAVAAALGACGPGTASAGTTTVTFTEAREHPIVVPSGVTSMRVVAVGGRGGDGNNGAENPGGFGARVTADLPVVPGSSLYLQVGGRGAGGSNFGGAGSGGGASDVRTSPRASGLTPTDPRLLVAAGGGGGGRGPGGYGGPGGDAGMPGGDSRPFDTQLPYRAAGGGRAAQPVGTGAGGTAGDNSPFASSVGQPGGLGEGGVGAWYDAHPMASSRAPGGFNGGGGAGGGVYSASTGSMTLFGGGGGGGGLHGGGGGGGVSHLVQPSTPYRLIGGAGGGGGSNRVPADGTATTDTTGEASITVSFTDVVGPVATMDAPPAVSRGPVDIKGSSATGLGDGAVKIEAFNGVGSTATPYYTEWATRDATTGAWTGTRFGGLDGPQTVRVSQVDQAGNVGPASTRTFVLDKVSPTVSLTSPVSESRTNDATPTFGGVAGRTPFDDDTVAVVTYDLDGQAVSGVSVARSDTTGAFTATPQSALPDGVYWTVALQADDAGNVGTSEPLWLAIDTKAPVPTLTAPAASSSLRSAPTFAGVGAVELGDVASVDVIVRAGTDLGGAVVATRSASVGPNGGYQVDGPMLADGTYTVQVRQQDTAGNLATTSPRTFTVDSTAPVLSLAVPAPAGRAPALPTFAGVAGTAAGDQTSVTLKLHAGATAEGPALQTFTAARAQGDGAYAATLPSALAAGTYTVVAEQADDAGNVATSGRRTFTVDPSPVDPPAVEPPPAGPTPPTGPAPGSSPPAPPPPLPLPPRARGDVAAPVRGPAAAAAVELTSAKLRVTKVTRRGSRVAVTGTIDRRARGRVTVTWSQKSGPKTVKRTLRATIVRGRFTATIKLPRTLARSRVAGRLTVTYAGDSALQRATATRTVSAPARRG